MTSHLRNEDDPKENEFYACQERLQRARKTGSSGNASEGQKGKWVHHNGRVPYQVDR